LRGPRSIRNLVPSGTSYTVVQDSVKVFVLPSVRRGVVCVEACRQLSPLVQAGAASILVNLVRARTVWVVWATRCALAISSIGASIVTIWRAASIVAVICRAGSTEYRRRDLGAARCIHVAPRQLTPIIFFDAEIKCVWARTFEWCAFHLVPGSTSGAVHIDGRVILVLSGSRRRVGGQEAS